MITTFSKHPESWNGAQRRCHFYPTWLAGHVQLHGLHVTTASGEKWGTTAGTRKK